jgi:RNA polymerase sigma-70 factor (ECF subfamily)
MSTIPAAHAAHTAPGFAEVGTVQAPEVLLTGLYERHSSRIFGFCRRRLRAPQEAEDALQNTFIAAMQALQRGTVPVCETAWLFKIAENACNGIYRSGARRDDRELTDPQNLSRFAGTEPSRDVLVGLEAALETIPENQRKAFVLRELRGLSYTEIATQLGVTVASVETLIYRARRGLARALEGGAGLRGRLTGAFDLGSIAAALKAWLGGASALKLGMTAAVIATAGVSAGDILTSEPHRASPVSKPSISRGTTEDRRADSTDHLASTSVPVEPGATRRHDPLQAGPELTTGRRPPSMRTDEGDRAPVPPTAPSPPSPETPSTAPQAPVPGPAPASGPAPPPAPAPPATSQPAVPPILPATPAEIPVVGEPLPSGLPVPETPPLPDVPAVTDLLPVPKLPMP